MSRLPAAAFATLVAATVGAFFVTQHLKVTTPLLDGFPAPTPAVIDPYNSATCAGISHRATTISFYLLHRADDVNVLVVDRSGAIVRTVAAGHHMRRGVRTPDGVFSWDGRKDDGSVAPDGSYYFRISLIHQGRTVLLADKPVSIKTEPPRPALAGVSPSLVPQNGLPVTIRYRGNENRGGTIRIYRTDLPGRPRLAKSFLTPWKGHVAGWNVRIANRPAPAGTYLVGLDVTDAACSTGHYPPAIPPPPGTTPHAGVTVRYLAAQPPLDPAAAGSRPVAYVDSRRVPYRWSLWRQGVRKPVAAGSSRRYDLHVPLPRRAAGLYMLLVRTSSHGTAVPLVAHGQRPARILVVLPALTWQGLNPVDDDGDGLPNTLEARVSIDLARPLASGLPADFSDEAAFLAYLDKTHLGYDLTTDLGLIDGIGPRLAGHAGVVLAGSERWVPDSLASALRSYVSSGGHLLSLGVDSLRRRVTIRGAKALDATQPASADALGARLGAPVSHNTDLITAIRDDIGIFSGTSGVFPGHSSYQPVEGVAAPAQILSEAGTTASAPSIVGYQLGHGIVVDVGLPGFGASIARSVDAQELVARLWKVLGG